MDLKPGQTLGPYRIEERLVSGGMAKVYRALQASTGREVAIKVLPLLQADAEGVARFQREMRVLAGLQHPHILGLIDAGEDGPWHYLVLPLVRRGDLADRIAREDGPLPLPLARRIVLQLCDALDYAHAQGVVHRDLKPANVLLDDSGNCLLTDFGIALPAGAERLTAAGFAVGTPEFLAPEQADGRADARSDLYALGLIVFQLVTGRMPFEARGSAGWMHAHREAAVPAPRALNPALPAALDAVVLKALAKNPAERYQRAADFAAAIRSALPEAVYAEDALPMPAETTVTPPRARRTRWIVPAAVAALVAAGLLLAARYGARPAAAPRAVVAPVPADAKPPAPPATDPSAHAAVAPTPSTAAPAAGTPGSLDSGAAQNPPAAAPLAGTVAASAIAPAEVYDRFDDPRFENRFDPSRWQLTRAGARMRFEQRGGTLHLRSQEREHGLYAEFAGSRLAAVGARVRMSASAASQASVGITVSRLDRPGQWVSCYVYALRGAAVATPVCTDQRRAEFRSGAAAAADAWHDLSLELDAVAQRAVVSADGRALGELPFPGADTAATWYVMVSGWSADGQPVEGDVARLTVDHRP